MNHKELLERAVALAIEYSKSGDNGPFGAVVARRGRIIAEGWNQVAELNDPTAHAEINAIRKACRKLKTFSLQECVIYTSCEPCPMCLAAIYWSRLQAVYYACTSRDAQQAGFDDLEIYHELAIDWKDRKLKSERLHVDNADLPFKNWAANPNKVEY